MTAGMVTDLESLALFLRGRLSTSGLVAAAVAAAACRHACRRDGYCDQVRAAGHVRPADHAQAVGNAEPVSQSALSYPTQPANHAGLVGYVDPVGHADPADSAESSNMVRGASAAIVGGDYWSLLDAETDARTPAPAQREASRRQGRALLRAARVVWPDAWWLAELAATVRGGSSPGAAGASAARRAGAREYRGGPHHAVVLGAAAGAAGCEPLEAARIAAYQAVAGPVSAAVRLLALDPMRATGVLAGVAGEIDQIAEQGAGYAGGPLAELPCPSAPALDLLAEAHVRAEVRLFES